MDQFVSTPSSSDVDLEIEKFRVEVNRSIDEANSGTRKLTLTSSVKVKTPEMNDNIDRQITDLENLIRKLQDEITEMYQNADKEVEEYTPIEQDSDEVHKDLSNETIILDKKRDNIDENENVRDARREKDSKEGFASEQYSHVFPLMIRDVVLPLDAGLRALGHAATEVLTIGKDENIPEKISLKHEIIDVWNELPEYKPKDNLEVLIDELQAEISEKMETLKDVNIEEESCSKFEEAQ